MDRRIKYTKKVIKEAFLKLLEEKELKRVTVSELCKIADINRATFYRYYLDVYDLFDKIQEEFAAELKNTIVKNENYTIESFSRGFLEVLVKEKELAKVIFDERNNLLFLNDILELTYDYCYESWKNEALDISPLEVEYATIFIFNGALGIINYWIKNDFSESVEEIANLIAKLSYKGIKSYIYKK